MSNDHIKEDALTEERDESDSSAAAEVKSDLVVEPQDDGARDSFTVKLEETLRETEEAVLSIAALQSDAVQVRSWEVATRVVESFRPVPWFIWRLSNYVFAKPEQLPVVTEGLVFGMRRLLFAAASDELLGKGGKINSVRQSLQVLRPDTLAAVSVIHAVCRRLATRPFDRIWRPILDDALLRARIGFHVGSRHPGFGPGRGMLAGFAGRVGLAILISSGELEQARQTLDKLATGALIRNVGLGIYRCDPLQVSAMVLSASGCGRDAAFGTVNYSTDDPFGVIINEEQLRWLAAFTVCEAVRVGNGAAVDLRHWEALNFTSAEQRGALDEETKKLIRRGHGWNWLV